MDIRETYAVSSRLDGFNEYKTPRWEVDHHQKSILTLSKSRSPKASRNYLESINKKAKQTPGPGQYKINPQSSHYQKKKSMKIDFNKFKGETKATYLNQVIKQKSKLPSVGKYQIVVDKTQQIRQKYKKRSENQREKADLFRPTALDQVNRDTLNVSPSGYDNIKPLGYKSVGGTFHPEHRRSQSLPKLPSAVDYRPIPVQYETFDKIKKQFKKKSSRKTNTFGSKKLIKSASVGPGPKYNLISQWVQKKDKYGHKKGKNLFRSVSTLKSPGIYH